ncbi:DUF1800 domain-containing protein [bacterium AH-315-K20]|nr:DUF1800 domain-containing protein [bacterium AH-315-K20]
MPLTTRDTLDRELVLSRLGRGDRVPGVPSTTEIIAQLLRRGSEPITAREVQRIAAMSRGGLRMRRQPSTLPAPTDWPGSVFVEQPPELPNSPAPDVPPEPGPGGTKVDLCASDNIRRLVDRTTFGFSWEQLDYAYTNGYDAYLEWQLDPDSIDDSGLQARLDNEFETLNETPRRHVLRARNDNYDMTWELLNATILRQATSKRQLYERMVEFWSDHFNIYLFKDGAEMFKPIDDRDVIRANPLGKFSDIVKASAQSPAMLTYLDGAFSFAWAPNENYARELMELHTIGVDNFTQQDVREVARCFTGYTIDYDENSPTLGESRFQSSWHDHGTKNVLGRKIPQGGGESDADSVIDILCHSPVGAPHTARFLSKKLAVRFWGENPPTALVDELAQTYLNTDGDIKSMLRVVLAERWLGCSKPRLKRPYHYALSAVRALPSSITGYWALIYLTDVMGQMPFLWAPPNGYPDSSAFWAGHMLPRWRYPNSMFFEQGEVLFDFTPFNKQTTEEVVGAINIYLFGGYLPRSLRAELSDALGQPPFTNTRIRETLGLAISSPAFQQY